MPMSASALRARNPPVSPISGLSTSPAVMASMPPQTMAPGPKRRARRGAVMPKSAKQKDGTEVRTPATLPLMCSPPRTSSSSAPRLVMVGRRLRAASARPATRTRPSHAGRSGAGEPVRVGGVPAWFRVRVSSDMAPLASSVSSRSRWVNRSACIGRSAAYDGPLSELGGGRGADVSCGCECVLPKAVRRSGTRSEGSAVTCEDQVVAADLARGAGAGQAEHARARGSAGRAGGGPRLREPLRGPAQADRSTDRWSVQRARQARTGGRG